MKFSLLALSAAYVAASVAEAIPAPRPHENGPRYYFPRVVKRQVFVNETATSDTASSSQSSSAGGLLDGLIGALNPSTSDSASTTPQSTRNDGGLGLVDTTTPDTQTTGDQVATADTDTASGTPTGPVIGLDTNTASASQSVGVDTNTGGTPTASSSGGLLAPIVTPIVSGVDSAVDGVTSVVGGVTSDSGNIGTTAVQPTVTDNTDATVPTVGPTGGQTDTAPGTSGGLLPGVSSVISDIGNTLTDIGNTLTNIGTVLPTPTFFPTTQAPPVSDPNDGATNPGSGINLPITTPDLPITTPDLSITTPLLPTAGTTTGVPDDNNPPTTPGSPSTTAPPPDNTGNPSTTVPPAEKTETPPTIPPTDQPTLPPVANDTQTAVPTLTPTFTPPVIPATTEPSAPPSEPPQSIVPTGTDNATAIVPGTTIQTAPPPSNTATDTEAAPTSQATTMPSNVPRVITPEGGVPVAPEGSQLIQIAFKEPLHYEFVVGSQLAINQIFTYLPIGVADGLNVTTSKMVMQYLQPYNTLASKHYITTLAMAFIPATDVDKLSVEMLNTNSALYDNPDKSVKTLMDMVDPTVPLLAGQGLSPGGTPVNAGDGNANANANDGEDSAPGSDNGGQAGVRPSSVGIAVGAVAGAAVYGAAMFLVARRYKKRKAAHQRASSVQTDETPRPGEGSNLMAGARNSYGSRMAGRMGSNNGRGSRNSDRSDESGRSGRTYISPPVMAENSLGWN